MIKTTNNMYDIFISYRRTDGYETAKHLFDLLTRDGYHVSFDIDTLRNGVFDEELLRRIDECQDFVLIVGKHTFDKTLDKSVDVKNDWVRCETRYALQKKKNIIPILLAGVLGFPDNLPKDINEISRYNGPLYNQYYFDDFYRKLKTEFIISKSAPSDNNKDSEEAGPLYGDYFNTNYLKNISEIKTINEFRQVVEVKIKDSELYNENIKYSYKNDLFIDKRTNKDPFVGKFIKVENFKEGIAKVQDAENKKWGYIDKSGEYLINPVFYEVRTVNNKQCRVKSINGWGIIDIYGNEIIPFTGCDDMSDIKYNKFLFVSKKNYNMERESVGVLDCYGHPIIKIGTYADIKYIGNNLFAVTDNLGVKCCDVQGNTLIMDYYDKIDWFYNGRAIVVLNENMGIINISGKLISTLNYKYLGSFKSNRHKTIGVKSLIPFYGNIGYVYSNGNFVKMGLWDFISRCFMEIIEGEDYFELKYIDCDEREFRPEVIIIYTIIGFIIIGILALVIVAVFQSI